MTRLFARTRLGCAALACVVVGASMLLAGCAAGGSGRSPGSPARSSPGPALPTNAATARLQRDAALAVCPRTPPAGAASTTGADRLPALTLPCLGGPGSVDLAALSGTPMLINIWASWCKPCYHEMPILQAVREQAAGRVRFLGVDVADDPNRALRTAKETGVRYPILFDRDSELPRRISARVQPVTLFVRADGSIAHTTVGPLGSAAQTRADITRYLRVRF